MSDLLDALRAWAAARAKLAVCRLQDLRRELGPDAYADWAWRQRDSEHAERERVRRLTDSWAKVDAVRLADLYNLRSLPYSLSSVVGVSCLREIFKDKR